MASDTKPKQKNWLLARSRQWHTWGGLIAALFLLIVGSSGIVLNYKQPVFSLLGLNTPSPKPTPESRGQPEKTAKVGPGFTTSSGLAAASVTLEQALALAQEQWGDVPLDRIELKHERGELTYRIKQRGGAELWVNALSGEHLVKGEYERITKAGGPGRIARQTDWGKILIDLHTGKIGGEAGKAVMSFAALALLFLSASGIYMWARPLMIRRQNARIRSTAASPASARSGPFSSSVPRPASKPVEV